MFESKIPQAKTQNKNINIQHDLLPLTPSLGKSLLLKSPVSVILEGRGVGGEGGARMARVDAGACVPE